MIQRIQSIYLLVSAILLGSCFFLPLATILLPTGATEVLTLRHLTPSNANSIGALIAIILTGLSLVANLESIFLYKKRKKQKQHTLASLVMMVVIFVVALIVLLGVKNNNVGFSFGYALIFPIIGSILNFLAFKGIKKDENLVSSYDRIR